MRTEKPDICEVELKVSRIGTGRKRNTGSFDPLHLVDKTRINKPLHSILEILCTCSGLYMTENKLAVLFCKLSWYCVPDEGKFGEIVSWCVLGEVKGITLEDLFVDLLDAGAVVMCYPVADGFGHTAGDEVLLIEGAQLGDDALRERVLCRKGGEVVEEVFFVVCEQELREVHGAEGKYFYLSNGE